MAHEVQIFDKTGRLVYRLTQEAGSQIGAFDHNGKKEFISYNGGANLQLSAESGAVIKQFPANGKLKDYAVYKQNGRPYVGILTDKHYTTIDLLKRKVLSKQNVDSTCVLAKSTTAVAAIQIQNNQVLLLQQGVKKQFQVPSGVVYLATYKHGQNTMFIFKRNTAIYAFDQQGNRLWEKTLALKELSQCHIYQQPSGNSCLAFLDAIGNQICLLDDLGRNLDNQDRHGEEQVQVTSFGGSAYSITTFLGTYLIQYTKQ
jgi:hypothetical protein